MTLIRLISGLVQFYEYLIIAYIIMSWFRPATGFLRDAYVALGTITEPYLGIFRRFIPPIGMIDISPLVALIVLQLLERVLVSVLIAVLR